MVNEIRTVCSDLDLKIEAYRFEGIMQQFPNHFHDYYAIGFIENGRRYLQCNNQEHMLNAGDMVIFNPKDTHTCEQALRAHRTQQISSHSLIYPPKGYFSVQLS